MMLMQVMGSTPRLQQEILHNVGTPHLTGLVVDTVGAFGRSVTGNVVGTIVGAVELCSRLSPVSLVEKYAPNVEQVANAGRYLKSAANKGTQALDRVNPVSIAVRNGPWYISQPLQFTRDELAALTSYLFHPVSSAQDLLEYFSKKPSRLAKLLRAGGADIPEDVIAAMKMEEDWNKAHDLLPVFIKEGIDPVKILNKDMARIRGKVLLTFIKACMGDETDLFRSLEKLVIAMLETAGTRVMAKTCKEAMKDKPVEKTTPDNTESTSDTEAEEQYYDALELLVS